MGTVYIYELFPRYFIVIPLDLENIGLESCEFCGYTAYRELVEIHRRSHQAL